MTSLPVQTFNYSEATVATSGLEFDVEFSDDCLFRPAGIPLSARREVLVETKEVGSFFHADFFALYLVRTGGGTHVIGDHEYGLSRGDVYVHPIGVAHNYRNVARMEQDAFYFQAGVFTKGELACLRRMKGFWRLLTPDPAAMMSRDYRLHLTPSRIDEVDAIIAQFCAMGASNDPITPMLARNQFVCLIGMLARWYGQGIANSGGATVHSADIANILEYCERNYSSAIRLPELASRIFMSVDHFAATFLREVGYTPAAYIRRLRMEAAYGLLRTSRLPVEAIGRQVGYLSGAQFARTFRKFYGLSPTEVRLQRKT